MKRDAVALVAVALVLLFRIECSTIYDDEYDDDDDDDYDAARSSTYNWSGPWPRPLCCALELHQRAQLVRVCRCVIVFCPQDRWRRRPSTRALVEVVYDDDDDGGDGDGARDNKHNVQNSSVVKQRRNKQPCFSATRASKVRPSLRFCV